MIAFPMMISQASESVMLFVGRLFLSRVSKVHLAAAMGGGVTNFMLTSFFAGVVGYVGAIVAQYYGSGRKDRCVSAGIQGVYLSLIAYPVILALLPFTRFFFQIFSLEAEQVALADTYLRFLLFGSVMLVLRHALTGFFAGIGRTRVVMIANLAAMIINVPTSYLFIFGAFGLPAMGMRGAALGILCGNFTGLLILGIAFIRKARSAEFRGSGQWRFDGGIVRKLLRFGGPAGTESFLNVGAFNLFVQMMHSYGPNVAAAVTISFNWDLVAFIPMLGLGIATTAIIAQDIGAGDHDEARASTFLILKIAFVYGGSMMVLFLTATRPLVLLFSSGFADGSGEVYGLAIIILRLASLYTVADAVQLIFAGALRGAGDTGWIMRYSVVAHWILAAVSFVLVRFVKASPVLVWCVFILMIVVLGVSYFLRFRGGKWRKIRLIEGD
jgi:multidrug resistance protein, MATE family